MSHQPEGRPLDPLPYVPGATAPVRKRYENYDSHLQKVQPPKTGKPPRSQQNRRSGRTNYINVIFASRKKSCNLTPMEATKALAAIAQMAGRTSINQSEAAEILGVSVPTISRREKKGWDLSDLLALADAFGVSRARLLLRLGYLDDADLFEVAGDDGLKGVPFSALTEELHRRATGA